VPRELHRVRGSHIKCLILLNFNIELNVAKEYLKKDINDQSFASNALKNNNDECFNNEDLENSGNLEKIPYSQIESVEKVNNNALVNENENQANSNENQNNSNSMNVNSLKQEGVETTKKRNAIANDKLEANMLDANSFTNLKQRIHKWRKNDAKSH